MRKPQISVGTVIAGVGIAIILYIILPSTAWWLIVGCALVAAGLALSKKCR